MRTAAEYLCQSSLECNVAKPNWAETYYRKLELFFEGEMRAPLLVNHDRLRRDPDFLGTDVTLSSVRVGARVRRGRDWRRKWRDDVVRTSETTPKRRALGVVVGYTDAGGALIGRNTSSSRPTDSITEVNAAGWACVRWVATGNESTYPIGAEGIFSLAFADGERERSEPSQATHKKANKI